LLEAGSHRELLSRVVESTGTAVLVVNYRRSPEHSHPLPVEDCLSAYSWLLGNGYQPEDIVLGGDSAGGGLVVSMLAAARTAGLKMPAGAMLLSPWLDLTDSFSGTWTSNQEFDYLPRDFSAWLALAYAGEHTLLEASPSNVSLEKFPPLLVLLGDCECLRDQVVAFVQKAKAAEVEVTMHVEPGMVHVYPMFAMFAKEDSAPLRAFEHMRCFVHHVFDVTIDAHDLME